MGAAFTPTLLLILDGWGQAASGAGNALSLAKTPTLDSLLASYPHAILQCAGRSVGLPDGYMGNSEVGHMNIGAGRIVYQDMTRIDMAVEEGSLGANPAVADTLAAVKKTGGTLHLMGLLSDGGVHSHMQHLLALVKIAALAGVPTAIHVFTDGRDTAPDSGIGFIRQLQDNLPPDSCIATITGRYYAMDRDSRWDRVQRAWDVMVNGRGEIAQDGISAIESAYAAGETDEFITPRVIVKEGQEPKLVKDGDAVFFFNFRADRARELGRCFFDTDFHEFDRTHMPVLCAFATMTQYDASYPMPVAFARQDLADGLGETVSKAGLLQLRIAETEKYAHVTYFFNGGREEPFPGEERRLVPSPRDVATYDLKPEMSIFEVTDTLLDEWATGKYALVVCNFANMDMVGHTGNIPAAIAACEAVDACVARVMAAVKATQGRLLVTADHGNADEMLAPGGTAQTAHSKNPVAFVLVDENPQKKLLSEGKLGDIAPTILHMWGVPVPQSMTGTSLYDEEGSQ